MPEAAQRLIVFRAKRGIFFLIIQLSCQEIALVASRYIEGRALTSCSSTLSLSIQAEIKHTFSSSRATRTEIREFKVQWPHGEKKNWHKKWAGPGCPSRPASDGPAPTIVGKLAMEFKFFV